MEPAQPIEVNTPLSAPEADDSNALDASSIMERFNAMNTEEPEPSADPPAEPESEPPAEPEAEVEVDPEALTPEELEAAKDMPGPKNKKAVSKWTELKRAEQNYKKLSDELPKKEEELQTLKAKLEELSKVDTSKYEEQLAERDAAIKEYEQRQAVFDVRSSREFQSEVSAPLREIGQTLDSIAQSYELDAEKLKDAVMMDDHVAQRKILNELLEGVESYDALDVREAVRKTKSIAARAQQLEDNAFKVKEELEFLKDQESRKSKEENERKLTTAAKAVQAQFKEKLASVFGDEEFTKSVFGTKIETDDPSMKAYNAYAGATLPKLVKDNAALQKEVAALKAAADKRRAATPSAGGNQGVSSTTTEANPAFDSDDMWQRAKAMGIGS